MKMIVANHSEHGFLFLSEKVKNKNKFYLPSAESSKNVGEAISKIAPMFEVLGETENIIYVQILLLYPKEILEEQGADLFQADTLESVDVFPLSKQVIKIIEKNGINFHKKENL